MGASIQGYEFLNLEGERVYNEDARMSENVLGLYLKLAKAI